MGRAAVTPSGPPVGTTVHLADCVRSGLDMVELMLDQVIDAWESSDDTPERFKLVGKTVGEAAMLLRLAHRALPDPDDRRRIVGIAARLAPHARTPAVRRTLVTRPSRAGMYTVAHGCLTAVGVEDPPFDRLARLALTSTASAANERVPYRLLDTQWARHLAFGDQELDHPSVQLSPIGVGVDLVAVTIEDAYAFTHALLYATDFGRVALPAAADADAGRLMRFADALAVKALDDDDLDLLSELLMAPATLRRPWTPTLTFSWMVLDRTWRDHGFVPGPGLPSAAEGESPREAVRRVIGTVYHTTFVAAMAAATALTTGHLPPQVVPAGGAGGGPGPDLSGRRRQWHDTWESLGEADRARLGDFTSGLALRRAADDLDLIEIRELVLAALARGGTGDPMIEQCAELVQRAVANE